MIHAARFRNFKALRDARIELGPFTVIVGPNASGKSSVLQGLQYLELVGLRRPSFLFRGTDHPAFLRSAGASDPIELEIEGEWGGQAGAVTLDFDFGPNTELGRHEWTYKLDATWGSNAVQISGRLSEAELSEQVRQEFEQRYQSQLATQGALLRRLAFGVALLRLEPARLAQASYSDQPVPHLDFDGNGLASVLAHMALTEPDRFQSLQESLSAVIPAVRRVRIDRALVRLPDRAPASTGNEAGGVPAARDYWGHRITLDMEGSPGTPAEAVSEGTLLVLGLLTALWSGGAKELVLLDDLDRGLHPQAMGNLIKQLRAVQARTPGLQIVATTHSPYLIDHFNASEVRLTALAEDGSGVVGSLAEHPEYGRWKDAMLPGEFWSTVGEKWLVERKDLADAAH